MDWWMNEWMSDYWINDTSRNRYIMLGTGDSIKNEYGLYEAQGKFCETIYWKKYKNEIMRSWI